MECHRGSSVQLCANCRVVSRGRCGAGLDCCAHKDTATTRLVAFEHSDKWQQRVQVTTLYMCRRPDEALSLMFTHLRSPYHRSLRRTSMIAPVRI